MNEKEIIVKFLNKIKNHCDRQNLLVTDNAYQCYSCILKDKIFFGCTIDSEPYRWDVEEIIELIDKIPEGEL